MGGCHRADRQTHGTGGRQVQAETDAADEQQSHGGVPVVLMRQDNDRNWAVMVRLDRLADLVSVLAGQACNQNSSPNS